MQRPGHTGRKALATKKRQTPTVALKNVFCCFASKNCQWTTPRMEVEIGHRSGADGRGLPSIPDVSSVPPTPVGTTSVPSFRLLDLCGACLVLLGHTLHTTVETEGAWGDGFNLSFTWSDSLSALQMFCQQQGALDPDPRLGKLRRQSEPNGFNALGMWRIL